MMEGRTKGNWVVIKGLTRHNEGTFEAFLRENVDWDIILRYDSIFEDVINWRGRLSQIFSGLAEMVPGAEDWFNWIISQGTAWTKKMGGIPEWVSFVIPCRLWVENSTEEVNRKLEQLYNIAVPEIGRAVEKIEQMYCSVMIGGWFYMRRAVIERISHKWSDVFVEGVPAWCDVDIVVSSVYVVERGSVNFAGKRIEVVMEPGE